MADKAYKPHNVDSLLKEIERLNAFIDAANAMATKYLQHITFIDSEHQRDIDKLINVEDIVRTTVRILVEGSDDEVNDLRAALRKEAEEEEKANG